MADIDPKDISIKKEGNIARFEFPDRIKDFKNFEERLNAILHVNIQVFSVKISRESGRIKIKITGCSSELDLENFRKIIRGIAIQY